MSTYLFHNQKGILDAVSILIFDGLRLSGIERSNYIESNNLSKKKLSGIRDREDPVFWVFYHIKNRREKFGTDEIVRFQGDSGIEMIRFRGFLLYCDCDCRFSRNIKPT